MTDDKNLEQHYSTATQDWRPTGARYTSARHAVEQWLRLKTEMKGKPAIDYEKALGVDTSPTPENPASLKAHEKFFLDECVFKPTRDRMKPRYWRVWVAIRRHHASLREAARREQIERREELGGILELESLRQWCANYSIAFPDTNLRRWCERHDVDWGNVEAKADGEVDEWDVLAADAGISQQTAKRYRDRVDAVVEGLLADEGALVTWALKDEADVRAGTREESRRRRSPEAAE